MILNKGESKSTSCPHNTCTFTGTRIGTHWYYNPEHRPPIDGRLYDIITGVLMGDGCIKRGENRNPYLVIGGFTEPSYLKYIDDIFGSVGAGVRLDNTAEENMQKIVNSGFSPNANIEDYNDTYRFRTRTHPGLSEFSKWYSSGDKVWTEDIIMTPEVLKHWFCCDGSWDNNDNHNRIRIGVTNEGENTDKIDNYFNSSDLPKPSNYNRQQSRNNYKERVEAEFTVNSSEILWDYMGSPPRGFEYKWPSEYK